MNTVTKYTLHFFPRNFTYQFLSWIGILIVSISFGQKKIDSPAQNPKTQDAWSLLERANYYYNQGSCAKALPLYRKAEDRGIDPDITAFNIGNCLYKMGKLSQAAASYRRSVRASEDNGKENESALLNLANVLFTLGEYPQSIATYNRYLKDEPLNKDAWLYLSDAYLRTKDFTGAQKALEKAYILDSSDASVVYQLSEIFVRLKEIDRAIDLVKKAYIVQPSEIDFLFYLGDLYGDQKNYEEAAHWYNRGIKAKPRDVEVYYKLADVLERDKKPFLAMETLQKALALDSNYTDAEVFLGNLAYEQKWWDRAEKAYLHAAKKGNREGLEGLRNLIYDLVDKKNFKGANEFAVRISVLFAKYPLFEKEIRDWQKDWPVI